MIPRTSKKAGAIILLVFITLMAFGIGTLYYFWDLQTKRCESLANDYRLNATQDNKNKLLDEFCNDELYKAEIDLMLKLEP